MTPLPSLAKTTAGMAAPTSPLHPPLYMLHIVSVFGFLLALYFDFFLAFRQEK